MFETKLLLNHALPTGDVTWGYQRPSMEHLRACAERIAEFLVEGSTRTENPQPRGSSPHPVAPTTDGT